jgi:hypothetical protein
MPFPFVAPLKEWTINKLKERESDRNYITTMSPFAMMSSGAVVMKGKTSSEIKELFKSQNYGNDATTYYGCVITNTTDVTKLYQTGKTIVGYDLNGKEIVVEGETNRRASTPIIESIEIDTDGGNNTLKTAQVKVKVFTLKQLEMFELFFLRPSMNVVLEYGWGSDIRNKSKKYTIDSKLFAKKNFKKYKEDYSSVFLNFAEKKDEYLTILKDLEGEYDYMVGKVSNFSYSPEEDGTYLVNIEVSAGNELQLWPALKSAKSKNSTAKKDKTPIKTYQSFIKRIASDLGETKFATIFSDESKWKNEFFNYGIVNDKQKNILVSKTPYISMKVIIEIINQLKLIKYSDQDGIVITYEYKGDPIIPVNSNPNIISTNEYVIFPGELPMVSLSKDSTENRVILLHETNKRIKGAINEKSFNIDNAAIYDFQTGKPIPTTNKTIKDLDENKDVEVKSNIGNLLNVFFSYDRFLEIFNNGNSIADIMNPVLETISDAMLGLSNLELQKPYDRVTYSGLEIIDKKIPLAIPKEDKNKQNKEQIYKFKIGALGSIVKNFNFNMEMSTLMQAQALYSTQLAIAKQNDKTSTDASKEIDKFVSADLSYATNADGYFSVNDMEVEIIKRAPKATTDTAGSDEKSKQEIEKELNDSIQSKYIKFLIPSPNGTSTNLIYKDSSLIQLYILPKSPAQSMALTYLDISIEIDGMAGFSCGEYFQIEGIPEVYNKNGYFQITNVKQGIDTNGWKTTIEAGYLLKTE